MTFLKFRYIILFLCFLIVGQAQDAYEHLRSADQAFKGEQFEKAEMEYRKALEKESGDVGTYNLGNSIYLQNRLEEAINHFSNASKSNNPAIRKKAFHNLGNSYFQAKEYDKSINAYKEALRLDSKDIDTKKNLA
ncbi:MAG: tetratricopeptide repeat protein, partial [Bacteroidota bacterium]